MNENSNGRFYSNRVGEKPQPGFQLLPDREALSRQLNEIPNEVKQLNRWVFFELLDNGKKMPISPRDLGPADCSNPATWGSFSQCLDLFKTGEGDAIGFSLTSPYVGFDLDKCYEEGDLAPFARGIVETADSYTETSVSGKGVHIILKDGWLRQ